MSHQFFESLSSEMGLFTFYKRQEEEDQLSKKQKEKRAKKRKPSRSEKQILPLQRPLPSQQPPLEDARNSDSCDEFLKSVRPKHKKLELSEVKEQAIQEHEEEKSSAARESNSHQQPSEQSPFHYKQFQPMKEKELLSSKNKLSASLLSGKSVRSQFYQKERSSLNSPAIGKKTSSRELLKQRIRTQVDHQLHKNHMDYILSAERDLIIGRKLGAKLPSKSHCLAASRPFKEKLHLMQNKGNGKVSSASEGALPVPQLLHEKNKRYFNKLMEHMSVQPEYNQTVYRILKDTLVFPQLPKNTHRHIKTQASSPQKLDHALQTRSQSYYKKVPREGMLSIAVKGRLAP